MRGAAEAGLGRGWEWVGVGEGGVRLGRTEGVEAGER